MKRFAYLAIKDHGSMALLGLMAFIFIAFGAFCNSSYALAAAHSTPTAGHIIDVKYVPGYGGGRELAWTA